MAIITFENGTKVNFDGNPTPEDVEFVAKQVGVSKSTTTAPEKPSLGKSIARNLFNVPAKLASTVASMGTSAAALAGSKKANLATQRIEKEGIDYPYIGKVKPIQSLKESFGTGAEAASFLNAGAKLPAIGRAAFKGQIAKTAIEGAKAGAKSGALYGAGTEMQNPDSGVLDITKSTLKNAAIGTATGAALGGLPIAPALMRKGTNAVTTKASTPLEAAGRVLQATDKEAAIGARALPRLDLKGIKTYKDLQSRVGEGLENERKFVDAEYELEKGTTKLADLAKDIVVGKSKTKVNYVDDALKQLGILYQKTGSAPDQLRIKELVQKARTKGITPSEINKIAREYGTNFKSKGFDKLGQALTKINEQMYENTRKGVKEVARSFLKSDASKQADKRMSDLIRVQDAIEKMVIRVNRLNQRTRKKGIGEKLGNIAGTGIDILSGGLLKGVVGKFIQSPIRKEAMDALEIEKELAKNLKVLQFLEDAPDDVLETIVRNVGKFDPKKILDLKELD